MTLLFVTEPAKERCEGPQSGSRRDAINVDGT
jgi:hypothetical protein